MLLLVIILDIQNRVLSMTINFFSTNVAIEILLFFVTVVWKKYHYWSCIGILMDQKCHFFFEFWTHLNFEPVSSKLQIDFFFQRFVLIFSACWTNYLNINVLYSCSGNLLDRKCDKVLLVETWPYVQTDITEARTALIINQGVNWKLFKWSALTIPNY